MSIGSLWNICVGKLLHVVHPLSKFALYNTHMPYFLQKKTVHCFWHWILSLLKSKILNNVFLIKWPPLKYLKMVVIPMMFKLYLKTFKANSNVFNHIAGNTFIIFLMWFNVVFCTSLYYLFWHYWISTCKSLLNITQNVKNFPY